MDEFADAMMQNLPEMLARDLAEQEDVFLARSMTSGGPSADLASEAHPPNVPQRNPSRVLHRLHQVAPETFLCSLRQSSVESAWRSEREAILKNAAFAASHHLSPRAPRRDYVSAKKHLHMKQETEQESRTLFLNGLNADWGSDSSADVEAGLSSPSVRTRKQSITTTATSVDVQTSIAEKRTEGYPAECHSPGGGPAGAHQLEDHPSRGYYAEDYPTRGRTKQSFFHSPGNHAAWLASNEGGSWVDLGEHENLRATMGMPGYSQGLEMSRAPHEPPQTAHPEPMMFTVEDDRPTSRHQPPLGVPERRSSLSHQVTTVTPDETADAPNNPTYHFSQELLPSPPTSPHQLPSYPPPPPSPPPLPTDWTDTEAALSPIVSTGRHQLRQNLQLDLSSIPPDDLSLPPLSATETNYHDRAFSLRSHQQLPNLLAKPRKSNSVTRMPLRNIHRWLESSSRVRPQSPMASPVAMSPTSSVRVSGPVFEALRSNVQNFPDTMLRTSSVTIDQIRDYSHKVKRSDVTRQLVSNHQIDEQPVVASHVHTPPTSPSIGRKGSFGNLKLVNSLRGKFTRFNFAASASACSVDEQAEANWPLVDDTAPATARADLPPLRPSEARDAACLRALHRVLPDGTPYLLDALCAHIIAYNYIDSLCGSLPEPHQNSAGQHLHAQPSQNVTLPPGVTSLADLMVQENVPESIVKDFQDSVSNVASRTVVPSKAASLLGLGSSNMGKPVKPSPGLFGAHGSKLHNASPPGASRGHYLESDSAMHSLREDIAHNIYRLVETVNTRPSAEGADTEEAQDRNIVLNGKRLDDMLMRALSELVRSYEEISC